MPPFEQNPEFREGRDFDMSPDMGPPNGDYSPPNGYDGYGPPGPPGSEMPPVTVSQRPTYALVLAIVLFVSAIALFVVSKKISKSNKLKWGSLLSIVVSIVLAVFFFTSDDAGIKAVKAPKIDKVRIIGVREPDISSVSSMLDNDIEELKGFGINTISLSPELTVLPSGAIEDTPMSEYDLKLAINKAHEAGFQVYLELAPIKTFSYIIDNPSILETTMKRLITKYAKVADDFNVAYYSPLSDSIPHPDKKKLNKFMQDILPKVRKHYSGNLVYHKQSSDFDDIKEIADDHSIEFEFLFTNRFNLASRFDFYNKKGGSITLSVDEDAISISNYSKGGRLFKEHMSIEKNVWRTGKIVQRGKTLTFYFNDEEMYTHKDDYEVYGSYAFLAGGSRVKNITIKDLEGNSLIDSENFANNWLSSEGWSIEGNEFVSRINPENPENYAGELFLVDDINYSGYDSVGISIWRVGTTKSLEDFKSGINFKIDGTKQQVASDGISNVIISRFGGRTKLLENIPDWQKEKLGEPMTNWELADTVEAILVAENGTTNGLIYDGWEKEGQGIKTILEVEQVIKRLFK